MIISGIWFGLKISMSINRDQRNAREEIEAIENKKSGQPQEKNPLSKKID